MASNRACCASLAAGQAAARSCLARAVAGTAAKRLGDGQRVIETRDTRQRIGGRGDGHGIGLGQEMDHPARLTVQA